MPDHNNERILIVMTEHPIQGMMDTTLERIREMVDASTVIGDPIVTGDTTIIPVSKISYGFASGGSDFPTKQEKDCFGGGGGAGVSVTPVAFLVISGAGVQLLHVDANRSSMDKLVGMIPDFVDKVSGIVESTKRKKNNNTAMDVLDDTQE